MQLNLREELTSRSIQHGHSSRLAAGGVIASGVVALVAFATIRLLARNTIWNPSPLSQVGVVLLAGGATYLPFLAAALRGSSQTEAKGQDTQSVKSGSAAHASSNRSTVDEETSADGGPTIERENGQNRAGEEYLFRPYPYAREEDDLTAPPMRLDEQGKLLDSSDSWFTDWHQAFQPMNYDGGFYLPAFERHRGANRDHLMLLDGKLIPASRLNFNETETVISEAPTNDSQMKLYYQMAIEQKSGLLISASSVYKSGKRDMEGFRFLAVEESIALAHGWTIQNTGGLSVEGSPFVDYTLIATGPDGEKRVIHQYLPNDHVVEFSSIDKALKVCDMIEQHLLEHQQKGPIVINCKTGCDRSVSLAVIRHVTQNLLQYDDEAQINWDGVVNELLYWAKVAESQVSQGAGIDTMCNVVRQPADLTGKVEQWWKAKKGINR